MKLRRDIEDELRRVVGSQISGDSRSTIKSNFWSISSLWAMAVAMHPKERSGETAFAYVLDTANASAHARSVPPEVADEAISLGLRILDRLRNLPEPSRQ